MNSLATLLITMHAIALDPTPVSTNVPVLEKTMTGANLVFEGIPDFWKVRYNITPGTPTGSKRAQTVFIRKAAHDYNSLLVHEAFGLIYDSPTPPSDALMIETMSRRFSIGGIVYEVPSATQKNYRFRFKFDLPQDTQGPTLREYLEIIAATADDLEVKLNPGSGDVQ
jgi:hypothetical protein